MTLQSRKKSKSAMGADLLRKQTTSNSEIDRRSLQAKKVQGNISYNCLADANEFKMKGDAFFAAKKYEKALKTYEIAYDLVSELDQHGDINTLTKGFEVEQLSETIKLQMLEAAFRLD